MPINKGFIGLDYFYWQCSKMQKSVWRNPIFGSETKKAQARYQPSLCQSDCLVHSLPG